MEMLKNSSTLRLCDMDARCGAFYHFLQIVRVQLQLCALPHLVEQLHKPGFVHCFTDCRLQVIDKILVVVCQHLCITDKESSVGEDTRSRMGAAHFGGSAVGSRHPVGADQPVYERTDTDRSPAGFAVGD